MCGRYQLVVPAEEMAALFALEEAPEAYPPRYNISPTQPVHVVHLGANRERRADLMRWGLIPSWVKDPKAFTLIINARSETAAEKPAFRNALRRRRALLPATGFYEWAREGTVKQPFLFETGGPFALAAITECWHGPNGEEMDTVAVLTASATGVPARYHDRMPLTVAPEDWAAWLDPFNEDGAAALALTEKADYTVRPVSRRLSNARNEGIGLMDADNEAPEPPPPAPRRPKAKPAAKRSAKDDTRQPRLL